jgi:hypothetical protein
MILQRKIKVMYHSDSSHGWYSVKAIELDKAGVSNKISSYSYKRGQTVYLEEDLDAGTFFNAVGKERLNVVSGSYKECSPIRNYQSYGVDHV